MSTLEKILNVDLGERSYEIRIGNDLLSKSGDLIAPFCKAKKLIIVTDSNVAPLYKDVVANSLKQAGIESETIVLPAGEATKSMPVFEKLLEDILALGIDRSTLLVALGGGVIGDITGFAASCLLRGLDFIQVPTTLLSQVDSSVGGKTGINARAGKNLIGAFHQPRLVIIDTETLNSLPERELKAGYAEVVKYGLLGDETFYGWLEENGSALLDGDNALRTEAILTSCKAKADVVARDEKEGGVRALLNLGHTFGHVLEKECGYDGTLLHGEAVAIGMVMAFDYSAQQGLCSKEDGARLKSHFQAVGMDIDARNLPCQNWTVDQMIHHMGKDKKVQAGKLVFILVRKIGEAFISKDVDRHSLKSYMREFLHTSLSAKP